MHTQSLLGKLKKSYIFNLFVSLLKLKINLVIQSFKKVQGKGSLKLKIKFLISKTASDTFEILLLLSNYLVPFSYCTLCNNTQCRILLFLIPLY